MKKKKKKSTSSEGGREEDIQFPEVAATEILEPRAQHSV